MEPGIADLCHENISDNRENVPNVTELYVYLHEKDNPRPRLSVEQHLEISLGVAKGLCHLHDHSSFVHGNITTNNIFLDANMVPKIIKYPPEGKNVYYTPPECYEPSYKLSPKTDVYAFGVVLLEVLCEKETWNRLVILAFPFIVNRELHKFTPEHVKKNIIPACARRCEKLIMDCMEYEPDKRPCMSQVVQELELAFKLQKDKDANSEKQSTSVNTRNIKKFSFAAIENATNKFSEKNLLGEGGYAKVYYGQSKNYGVAVKRMTIDPKKGIPAFKIERKLLLACEHDNIISLKGCHYKKKERILVYEFMPNGSLYDHIHKPKDNIPRLTVEQRLEICIGVAKGLNYLHSRKDYRIIHSDLKTENILLDDNFAPKISDFGLSRTRDVIGPSTSAQVTNHVHGTLGYIAPECYEANYKPSRKADVYAFGMILLEVLCEKPAWERLVIWAQSFLFKGELPIVVPEHVRKYISPECSQACMNLIRDCLNTDPNKRPSMSNLIVYLDFALTLQKMNLDSNGPKRRSQANIQELFSISYKKIATPEFVRQISGKVYHGNMSIDVAVKHINTGSEKEIQSFKNEIDLLSSCHHANVISLLGYCDEPNEKFLVYEFMANGSLYDYLHNKQDRTTPLTAEQRLWICFGVAKGLSYLHFCTRFPIIHHDLNSHNILLDRNFVAKISHFGHREDPYQYEGGNEFLAPECYENKLVNEKTDVYAFGVLLLEVLCDSPAKDYLLSKARPSVTTGNLLTYIPKHVKINEKSLQTCEKIINHCLETDRSKRPSMKEVVGNLDLALRLQMDGQTTS